jgi:hypothetical protein
MGGAKSDDREAVDWTKAHFKPRALRQWDDARDTTTFLLLWHSKDYSARAAL